MGTYSTLFQRQSQPEPQAPDTPRPVEPNGSPSERPEFRTEKRPEMRTTPLPIKRRTKRYSFEFYEDQLVKLKQLKRQAEDRGESLTLSDMARAALDVYLADKE